MAKDTLNPDNFMELRPDEPKRMFVEQHIPQHLKCSICYDVFTKPRRLFCGHTFCKECLQNMFKPHKNPEHIPRCALCRVEIDTYNSGYDLIAMQIIDEMEVICPTQGCLWQGQSRHLKDHYDYECIVKSFNQNTRNEGPIIVGESADGEQGGASIVQNQMESLLEDFDDGYVEEQQPFQRPYDQCVKTMGTVGTQTPSDILKRLEFEHRKSRTRLEKKVTQRKSLLDHVSSLSLKTKKKKKKKSQGRQFYEESSALSSLADRQGPVVVNLEDKCQKVTLTRRSRPGILRM